MAKRIEVRLALPVVRPLIDFLLPLAKADRDQLPVPQDWSNVDEDLRAHWREDLVAALGSDLAVFTGLFDKAFRSTGVVEFDQTEALAVLRACSILRLRLRSGDLAGLSDEALESGEIDFFGLDEKGRLAFTCYLFLASLQETLVRHLDPEIGAG
jgi:hypothetical protein